MSDAEAGSEDESPARLGAARFEDFYRTTYAEVARALALTLGNRELGQEATDEAMTRALQRWRAVSRYDNPAGWVYRVGLNWALSFLRRRRRESLGVYVDPAYLPESAADPKLDAALAGLQPKQRAVLVLRYYLDWSMEDIAMSLGVPMGTAKSRLHRALGQLERKLGAR